MLPPGHIAAGYFTGYAAIEILKPAVTEHQRSILLGLSAFFGFAPDLDMFWAFVKVGSFSFGKKQVDHRLSPLHKPILWLVTGLLIYFGSTEVFYKYVGLMLWLGSWSHFVLDSLDYGIKWLWPFNDRFYAVRNLGTKSNIHDENSFVFWWKHIIFYFKTLWLTAYTEVLILVLTVVYLLR